MTWPAVVPEAVNLPPKNPLRDTRFAPLFAKSPGSIGDDFPDPGDDDDDDDDETDTEQDESRSSRR